MESAAKALWFDKRSPSQAQIAAVAELGFSLVECHNLYQAAAFALESDIETEAVLCQLIFTARLRGARAVFGVYAKRLMHRALIPTPFDNRPKARREIPLYELSGPTATTFREMGKLRL